MKKLLFISLIFLGLLTGCKGGAGNTPDVPEQFDLNKINFDYEMREGYEEYNGLELFKKVSNNKDHYLFYIENNISGSTVFKVLYSDEILGTIKLLHYTKYKELSNKYFNLELNVEEPETFKDYTYEFEKLENKIHLVILPAVNIKKTIGREKFIESDDYPLYYSDDEKDIHIGFTFGDQLLQSNCALEGVYNYTDLTNKNNAKYCVPVPFCLREKLSLDSYNLKLWSSGEDKKFIKDIIGLEYKSFSDLSFDYEEVEKILENNEDISNHNMRFYNHDFNEEHYNYIKNHGTTFNISFDKLCFKGIYDEDIKDYNVGLTAKINSIELYELDNEKYIPTVLSESEYPTLYTKLKEREVDIILDNLEISPYEIKILGWNYKTYRY